MAKGKMVGAGVIGIIALVVVGAALAQTYGMSGSSSGTSTTVDTGVQELTAANVWTAPPEMTQVQKGYFGSNSVDFQPIDVPGAQGSVTFYNSGGDLGTDQMTFDVSVNRLPLKSLEVYEAWLVDVDTGYMLSLGALDSFVGDGGSKTFKETMVHFASYDRIVIAKKQSGSPDPRPGTPVLWADIPGAEYGTMNNGNGAQTTSTQTARTMSASGDMMDEWPTGITYGGSASAGTSGSSATGGGGY